MAILRSDLVIYKPEQLGNTDQAGGQRTNNPVVSGQLNNLFPPISDIDHAQSALQIAKCYPTLDTAGTEQLIGAHVFINQPPVDPLVNVLLVESDDLTDATRRPGMVDILESNIVPSGLLFGAAGNSFIPNQDTFFKSQVTAEYIAGQVIVISVEYTGAESTTWPRFSHYARIVETSPRGVTGNVRFTPPIPQATPPAATSINGQTDTTKIRSTTTAGLTKIHGVSSVTGPVAQDAIELSVNEVSQRIVPGIAQVTNYQDLRPFADYESGGTTPTFARKEVSQVATAATVYTFEVLDKLGVPVGAVSKLNYDYEARFSTARTSTDGFSFTQTATVQVSGTTVTVLLQEAPRVGSLVRLSYISSDTYENYNSSAAFPVQGVLPNTISATARFISTNSVVTLFERTGGAFYTANNIYVGNLNYTTGAFSFVNASYDTFAYVALVQKTTTPPFLAADFQLAVSNPRRDTFYLRATTTGDVAVSASSDIDGVITGAGVSGTINSAGVVSLTFTSSVKPETISYDVQDVEIVVPPASVYGIDPLRIPNSGIVPIFHEFNVAAIQHSQFQSITGPAPAQVKTIRVGARFVDIVDSTGASLWTANNEHYTVDSDAGTVTLNSSFPGFTGPFVLTDTIGELVLVTGIDTNTNKLTIAAPLTREYPAGSTVASVQDLDDLGAIASEVFDMSGWNGNWDTTGTPANGNLNTAAYPIEMNNKGAINEDWAIVFTSSTAFNVFGKGVGLIASGDTLNDLTPINTKVGQPYFTIRSQAFGGGWNGGEAIRFRTFAAAKPVMLLRVVKSGHSQITTDRTVLSFRGNEA